MENGDLYKVRLMPQKDYQDEEPKECILQSEGVDDIRHMYPREYKGKRFQSPNGKIESINRFQSLQDSGEPSAAYNVIHNPVQNGALYCPEQIGGGSLIHGGGGGNEDRYQYGVHRNRTPPKVDHYRNMHAKSFTPQSSPPNLSFSGLLDNTSSDFQGYGRRTDGKTSSNFNGEYHNRYYSLGGYEDARHVNSGHHKSYRGHPKAASRASRHREGALPIEKQVNYTVRTSQGPKAASRGYSSHREVTLPNQKRGSFSGIRSQNPAVTRVNGEQTVRSSQGLKAASGSASVKRVTGEQTVRTSRVESRNPGNVSNMSYKRRSEVQHGYNNAVKTSQNEPSSSYSRLVLGDGGTKRNNYRGKPDHTPKYLSAEKSKDFTSHFQKSQSHRTPSSHQVLEKQVGSRPSEKPSKFRKRRPSKEPSKFRKQPSEKPSKQPSEWDLPTDHISWDGSDDPTTQPFGQNCHLCDNDLAYSPTGEELDPSILQAVSVLPCGHAFHCQCLEFFTPEEQSTDPPCFICVNLS